MAKTVTPKNTSAYVLYLRANPHLRNDEDRECLAKAEAKRARRAARKEERK